MTLILDLGIRFITKGSNKQMKEELIGKCISNTYFITLHAINHLPTSFGCNCDLRPLLIRPLKLLQCY